MGVVYGIDFGTSTSAVVVLREDGTAVRVRDPGSAHGLYSVPTAVCAQRDGTLVIGAAAERSKRMRPDTYRSGFKREFGDPTPASLGDRSLSPHELAAEVLAFLRGLALAAVADEPERIVITVPASWESGSRDLMTQAARRAGFDTDRLTLATEPVAAAAYAAHGDATAAGQTVLIYDLGGGTFDCAVARHTDAGGFEVLGRPGGIEDIGGLSFDNRILRHVRQLYPDECNRLFDGAAADAATWRRRLQLRDTCESVKIQLSIAEAHEEILTEFDPPVELELSRADLERLIAPLIEETVDECERMLAEQDLAWSTVDAVVPVGGSSRLPMIAAELARRSGRPVRRVDDPDLAIAHGAALLAARAAWPPAAVSDAAPTEVEVEVEEEAAEEPAVAGQPGEPAADAMSAADLLAEVRRLLAAMKPTSKLWLAPDIPSYKLSSARSAHKVDAGEEVFALYDFTFWGGAKESALFTTRGLRLRNGWGVAGSESIHPYTEFPAALFRLDAEIWTRDEPPRSVGPVDRSDVFAMRNLVYEIVRLAGGTPVTERYQATMRAAPPRYADGVRALLAATPSGGRLCVGARLTPARRRSFEAALGMPAGEELLAVYNLAITGDAGPPCLALTDRGVRFRGMSAGSTECAAPYERFATNAFEARSKTELVLGDGVVRFPPSLDELDLPLLRGLFERITALVRGDGPPAPVSPARVATALPLPAAPASPPGPFPAAPLPPSQARPAAPRPDRFRALLGIADDRQVAQVLAGPARRQVLDDLFAWLCTRYRPRPGGHDVVLHWVVDGEVFELVLTGAGCLHSPRPLRPPALSLVTAGVSLFRLASGRAAPLALYLSGEVRLVGDVRLAGDLGTLFALGAPAG